MVELLKQLEKMHPDASLGAFVWTPEKGFHLMEFNSEFV